jgi:hypothetical protein
MWKLTLGYGNHVCHQSKENREVYQQKHDSNAVSPLGQILQ